MTEHDQHDRKEVRRSAMVRTTPLHSVHVDAGALFTDVGGWRMPLRYAPDLAEHHAVRRSAGIFDLSHMGEIKVSGPDAATALDRALAGRISDVELGRALHTTIVAEDGEVIDDLIVHHVGDQEYLVIPSAGNRERVAAALTARGADVSWEILAGVVESGAGIPTALRPEEEGSPADDGGCGPDVLCGPTILRRLRNDAAVRATAAGHAVLLARTGDDCFELFCGAEDVVDLWTVITEYAKTLRPGTGDSGGEPLPALTPCGLAARDSLRPEAGVHCTDTR